MEFSNHIAHGGGAPVPGAIYPLLRNTHTAPRAEESKPQITLWTPRDKRNDAPRVRMCGGGSCQEAASYDRRSPPSVSKRLLIQDPRRPPIEGSVLSCGWDPGPNAVVF